MSHQIKYDQLDGDTITIDGIDFTVETTYNVITRKDSYIVWLDGGYNEHGYEMDNIIIAQNDTDDDVDAPFTITLTDAEMTFARRYRAEYPT